MKKYMKKAFTKKPVRFAVVGVFNTFFNFILLNAAFFLLGQNKVVSGFVATSFAVVVSFFLNRSFVFKPQNHSWRQPVMFAVVTTSGVLLVQNLVYIGGIYLLHDYSSEISMYVHDNLSITVARSFIEINASNVLGSLAAMIWNYNGYKFFVFNDTLEPNEKDT
jgi:putative flippase GtrA